MLMLGVILLALLLIYIYMVYMNKISDHFQNQNYNEYACKYIRENEDTYSIDSRVLWAGEAKAKPMEAAKGVASCGLELPLVTNKTGNITEIIQGYAADACEYGRNNTFSRFVWVRSLPVNVTNGDIDYATIAPSGPPGMDPCYLIWRINTTYVEPSLMMSQNNLAGDIEDSENTFKSGKILQKVPTTLRIDYLGKVPTMYDYNIFTCVGWCNPVDYIEIWGVPE